MHKLLGQILNAHGGIDRWNQYEKVEATIVSGAASSRSRASFKMPTRSACLCGCITSSSVFPYGAPDQRTMFTPQRIAIEKLDGTVVAERTDPKDPFARNG
jgi:hypothetical protein